ncbi:MAG: hypothetical protein EU547_07010 [Promethearchaeota archaeon]|nr:MAG: hypothetical protein EU547_07010 [Candidatus Lokiarchaeota archaeon]
MKKDVKFFIIKFGLLFTIVLSLIPIIYPIIPYNLLNTHKINLSNSNNFGLDQHIIWGGNDSDCAYDIALDDLGNIYITGDTKSYNGEGNDVFIAKFNNSGYLLWNKTWGSLDDDYGYGLVINNSNDIFVTGTIENKAFISKYNSSGFQVWERIIGFSCGNDIILDQSNNIYITGYDGNRLDNTQDFFIAKYNSSGFEIWNKTSALDNNDVSKALTLDNSGNVYITGYFNPNADDYDLLLAKYDSSGVQQWNETWGEIDDNEFGYGILIDNLDNLYVCGSILKSDNEAILMKYDSNKNLHWIGMWGRGTRGHDLRLDNSGNVYVTGFHSHNSAFIAKISPSGKNFNQKTWGDFYQRAKGYGIVIDESNNLFVSGKLNDIETGSFDAFIAKYIFKDSKISMGILFIFPAGIMLFAIIFYLNRKIFIN